MKDYAAKGKIRRIMKINNSIFRQYPNGLIRGGLDYLCEVIWK